MKRLANYLIAMALMAFTFTSCEDVPNPFGQILPPGGADDEVVVIAPKGSGTQTDPYNVAAAIAKCKEIGDAGPSTESYYVEGVVTVEGVASGGYGNATFKIADDPNSADVFTAYQVCGLGGAKMEDGYTVPVGAKVIIYGPIYNYKGSTPETAGKGAAYIYSLDGKTEGGGGGSDTPTPTGDAKGSGTQADPYNAAGANKYIASLTADTESEKEIFIKGKLVKYANNGEFNAQYGNASFYLSDDGTESSDQFYVFRTLYLGNVKYTEGATPKVGDEIVICGKVVNYKGNTPETVANKSYIYTWEGNTSGGGGTPSGGNDGSLDKPFTPAEANALIATLTADTNTDKDYYIKGKLVKYANNGEFGTQYGNATFYLSADGTENGEQFYVFRTLYLGNVKYTDDSWTKPKQGDEIIICGKLVNYKGNTPETVANQSYIYSMNGQTAGGSGESGGGSGNTGNTGADGSTIISVADFNAAAVSTDVWYQLTGTIKNLKDGDLYGNFDLEDATGSVYVYGVLSEKGGEKKKFQDLVAAKGIANGKKITIVGTRGEYNGKIEVMNAYFIKVE